MCIVLFAWQQHREFPLVVAANRDEFYHRPAEASRWREGILCGLDIQAGGTWIGVSKQGRFAVITNFREPIEDRSHGIRSRGELPMGFLCSDESPADYCHRITQIQEDYAGFNLLVGDAEQLWYLSNRGAPPQPVNPGIHGLSNGLLDTPWPKVERGKYHLEQEIHQGVPMENLLELLQDDWQPDDHWLPDTGVGIDMERLVSPIFISTPEYGTRASTVLRLTREGTPQWMEQCWHANGKPATRFRHDS